MSSRSRKILSHLLCSSASCRHLVYGLCPFQTASLATSGATQLPQCLHIRNTSICHHSTAGLVFSVLQIYISIHHVRPAPASVSPCIRLSAPCGVSRLAPVLSRDPPVLSRLETSNKHPVTCTGRSQVAVALAKVACLPFKGSRDEQESFCSSFRVLSRLLTRPLFVPFCLEIRCPAFQRASYDWQKSSRLSCAYFHSRVRFVTLPQASNQRERIPCYPALTYCHYYYYHLPCRCREQNSGRHSRISININIFLTNSAGTTRF